MKSAMKAADLPVKYCDEIKTSLSPDDLIIT